MRRAAKSSDMGNGDADRNHVGGAGRSVPASRRGAAGRKPTGRVRRTQAERSAETRGRLLDAAIQVLKDEGYANLTISKVAQRAGLTNGAIQHYFPSRVELMLAVMEAVYPVLEIPFDRIAAQDLNIRDRIDQLVEAFWKIYRRPEYVAIWDIGLGSRNDKVLRARFDSFQQHIFERVAQSLAALFADAQLSLDEVEQVFTLPIAYLRGCALQNLVGADRHRHIDLTLIKDVTFEQLIRVSPRASALASTR